MKDADSAMVRVCRAFMELAWRYAWACYLIYMSSRWLFPLPAAAGILGVSALLNLASSGRRGKVIWIVLLNIAGSLSCVLMIMHHYRYPAFPFWTMSWVSRLVGDPVGIVEWFSLLVTVYALVLIWQGGWHLRKRPENYLSMGLQFDKGLGLLFGLLIVEAVFQARAGQGLPTNTLIFPASAYLIFGLASMGLSRHQHAVEKSFLAGYRGLGIIFSIAAMAILLGSGLIFLFHPFLFPTADALLAALDQTTAPLVPYLIRFLRYLLTPEHRMNVDGIPGSADTAQIDLSPASGGEWLAPVADLLVGATMAATFIMVAFFVFYVLKRLLAWLLSEAPPDGPPLTFRAWALGILKGLMALPLTLWHSLAYLFMRVDSAAFFYGGLLKWGRHSGVTKRRNETPNEYGNRLMRLFPELDREIHQIVNAFNREIYGLVQTGPDLLADIRKARRRMKRLRFWPQRAKVWLMS